MHASFASGVLLFAAMAMPLASSALDWEHWRGPDYNGISKESGWRTTWPAAGPKKLWQASVGTGFSSFAVSHGRVYTMGNKNDTETVYCFNADNGTPRWKHSYPCPIDPNVYEGGPNATPTVDGNAVFTFSRTGDVFALNADTGAVLWQKNVHREFGLKIPEWGFSSSPVVQGKLLILNAGSAGIALNKETGAVAWTTGNGETAGYSSAVPIQVGGQQAMALFSATSFEAVSLADGQVLWQFPWPTSYGANIADPVLVGDKFFVSSGYNQGCALLEVSDGTPTAIWRNKNMRNHFNSSVLVQGYIYGVDESSELRCLDAKSGTVKWSEKGLGKGSLTVADGKLIIMGERGQLVIADSSPSGFKRLAEAQPLGGKCWTTPVLSSGRIYCRNSRGDVVCLDVAANHGE